MTQQVIVAPVSTDIGEASRLPIVAGLIEPARSDARTESRELSAARLVMPASPCLFAVAAVAAAPSFRGRSTTRMSSRAQRGICFSIRRARRQSEGRGFSPAVSVSIRKGL